MQKAIERFLTSSIPFSFHPSLFLIAFFFFCFYLSLKYFYRAFRSIWSAQTEIFHMWRASYNMSNGNDVCPTELKCERYWGENTPKSHRNECERRKIKKKWKWEEICTSLSMGFSIKRHSSMRAYTTSIWHCMLLFSWFHSVVYLRYHHRCSLKSHTYALAFTHTHRKLYPSSLALDYRFLGWWIFCPPPPPKKQQHYVLRIK